jgi:hypothetical protein
MGLPPAVHVYHSLVPLDAPSAKRLSSVFRAHTSTYKVTSSQDGLVYALRRVHGAPHAHSLPHRRTHTHTRAGPSDYVPFFLAPSLCLCPCIGVGRRVPGGQPAGDGGGGDVAPRRTCQHRHAPGSIQHQAIRRQLYGPHFREPPPHPERQRDAYTRALHPRSVCLSVYRSVTRLVACLLAVVPLRL